MGCIVLRQGILAATERYCNKNHSGKNSHFMGGKSEKQNKAIKSQLMWAKIAHDRHEN